MITETTVIAAIIGAAGTALVGVIKAAFSRNQNKKDQMDHEENLVKISQGINYVDAALSDIKNTFTEINIKFDKFENKLDKFHDEQKMVNQALLRHDITATYECFKDKGEMPKVIYESTMSLYDNYKASGGNSFIDEEVEEMKKWKKV